MNPQNCPWCRSRAQSVQGSIGRWVQCNNCGALGPSTMSEETALAEWNRIDLKAAEATLKPCPFCGDDGMVADRDDGVTVDCLGCGLRGPLEQTEKDAIAGWNCLPRR